MRMSAQQQGDARMKTVRIALCIAAMTPGMLLAEKAAETPAAPPANASVTPAPAAPAATTPATAPTSGEATPTPAPSGKRPPRPGFSGILDVAKDADGKIIGIALKTTTNTTHIVKIDEQSLKMADSAAGKRVHVMGKLITEVVDNTTNTVLKVDSFFPPRRMPPRQPKSTPNSTTTDKSSAPISTEKPEATPAATLAPPAPATPAPAATTAPATHETKK
jgi:hypothetical protein